MENLLDINSNVEYSSTNIFSDNNNTTVKDVAENIHTVLSVLTFVIIIIFLYRYLKTVFKRRS